MDPRQRLALELTGNSSKTFVVPETLRGKQVSRLPRRDDRQLRGADASRHRARDIDHHSFAGVTGAMIANRISYAFGLHGPSMIDYIEAHGTGTKVGDSIEARALGEIFPGAIIVRCRWDQ